MPRVVVFDEFGGPEVMHVVEEPFVEPAAGEVRVRIEAFAVNPLDQMMRSGTSPAIVPLPHARLGVEGTGVIDALGPGVTGLETGDPVILTAIPDASGGSGADIVLDLVMGPGQQDLLKAGRPGGSLVAAGFLDPRPTPFPASALTIFSYRGFDYLLDDVVVKRMAAFMNAGVLLGALRPAIGKVFALDDVV
jgi:NADPH:quinone reductase-like Zn-dependent oxidoreductase